MQRITYSAASLHKRRVPRLGQNNKFLAVLRQCHRYRLLRTLTWVSQHKVNCTQMYTKRHYFRFPGTTTGLVRSPLLLFPHLFWKEKSTDSNAAVVIVCITNQATSIIEQRHLQTNEAVVENSKIFPTLCVFR